jgi:alginate O-acetyltransferase complex protein AlgI
LPINFNSPYKAINCGDFWKRWHISLSTWLRDYLYIPLGGNRRGTKASFIILGLILTGVVFALGNLLATIVICTLVLTTWLLAKRIPSFSNHINTNINLMLTMLIGGLWHGASWKFVLWGGLNGLGIVIYKYWRRVSPYEAASGWFVHAWKIAITFFFITYVRIYFRGESMDHISRWYRQIANNMDLSHALDILSHYRIVFIIMLLGYITHWLPQKSKNTLEKYYANSPLMVKGLVVTIVSVLCYQAFSSDFQPFIYFQF